jgi:hypothetical protein
MPLHAISFFIPSGLTYPAFHIQLLNITNNFSKNGKNSTENLPVQYGKNSTWD